MKANGVFRRGGFYTRPPLTTWATGGDKPLPYIKRNLLPSNLQPATIFLISGLHLLQKLLILHPVQLEPQFIGLETHGQAQQLGVIEDRDF